MKWMEGGVCAAKGFEAAGVEAAIKYKNRKDMALIFSEKSCKAAGVFTSNVVKAAPVLWDKQIIDQKGNVHAVVVNSGIANACTGEVGKNYCMLMAAAMANVLRDQGITVSDDEILVASTGVIGMQLPVERIEAGCFSLAQARKLGNEAGHFAANAIMTTDTRPKETAVSFMYEGKVITVGGMCKGSGMIHPDMCTMLAFVTTDMAISQELLQEALKEDVKDTFNMVSVDGDTSTNDTLLVLANGEAGNTEVVEKNEGYQLFAEALRIVNTELAKKIAGDGEGATALFETKVIHAKAKEDARKLSKSVICSSLTKAAIFGHDANWGRILCAMGYAGVDFNPDKVELYFKSKAGTILIFKDGKAANYSEEEATKILSCPEVTVLVDMKMGEEEATAWGCDLTYDYVKINADYRS